MIIIANCIHFAKKMQKNVSRENTGCLLRKTGILLDRNLTFYRAELT